jgi:hypothetical protein
VPHLVGAFSRGSVMSSSKVDNARVELIAAAAVAQALDANLIRRDLPGRQQTRDFDLVFADEGRRFEPLEVTTFASRPDLETWRRLDRLGSHIEAPELDHVWYLDVGIPINATSRSETLDVRRIRREVVPALAALEARGEKQIEYGKIGRNASLTSALQQLSALGIDGGHATPPLERDVGGVELVAPVGGFSHPDCVAGGVENEAAKADNRKKLAEPQDAARRHLAVLFDASSGVAFNSVRLGGKGRLPLLPQPITTAWAIASDSLLGATPPADWTNHRIPQRVFDSPEDWLLED